MTNEEAYKNRKECLEYLENNEAFVSSECLEAARLSVAALEKQIPKKPIKDRRYTIELCPVCNDFVRLYAGTPMNNCCNCGQRLDWSEA